MRRFIHVLLILATLFLTLAGIGVILFVSMYPDIDPAPQLTIDTTPERIARGKYLVTHVTVCLDCHSTRDWNYYAGPIKPGTFGKGGAQFGPEVLPGTFYASNITSGYLGHWTDGEIVRAITSGVNRDGNALFSLMPYEAYNRLAEEDVQAIVAYIRTLRPIASNVPERKIDFPMSLIIRTFPIAYTPQPRPDVADSIAYGAYLTTIAGCATCHTPQEKGKKIQGMAFAGGFEFPLSGQGAVQSTNITPDQLTGIGSWSKKTFIDRFKMYANPKMQKMDIPVDKKNTVMPWLMYAGMKEKDLEAIYIYLRTIPPVRNKIGEF